MWDFSQYTSRERAFSFSRGALATMGAGVGVGAGARIGAGIRAGAGTKAGAGTRTLASRTALRILCKSFSEYLKTLVATKVLTTGGFGTEQPAGWSDNSSPKLGGEKESGRAIEGATEGQSWRGCPRSQIEVILELISSKTLFQTGWLTRWVWRN